MALRIFSAESKCMPSTEITLQRIKSEDDDVELSLRSYQIMTYPADYTLEGLVVKWSKEEIKKEGFQRKYVWPIERASKLIESFLIGLPVPPVYLYEDVDSGAKLIVDGHQRLRSIVYFFSGWFGDAEEMKPKDIVPFKLTGLHEDSPYLGETYQSLEQSRPDVILRFKDAVLRSFIMKQVQPEDDTSMFEIFSRFNTGGMPLMPQEIRNCVATGEFNELLKTLNQNNAWRQIMGTQGEDKRMRDVELILRFLALTYTNTVYTKPMKNFLNKFMRRHRHLNRPQTFQASFETTAESVLRCLGSKPFHIKRGLNAAVFDSVFHAFAVNIEEAQDCNAQLMQTKYQNLLADDDFQKMTSSATTDDEVVRQRLEKADEMLFG